MKTQSDWPLVSAIIPTRNRKTDLASVLGHLQADGYPALEVLVMDNSSTDGTLKMLAENYRYAQVVKLPANLGTEARNEGLARAGGEFVLMLDSDSHPTPGCIARMVRHFQEDPTLAAAAFHTILPGEDGVEEVGGSHNVFIGCGCGFRTDALRKAGGYPSGYGFYVEEYDVSYRLLEMGYGVRYFPDLVVLHEKSSSGRDFGKILCNLVRNNIYLYTRYFPLLEAARTLNWQLRRYGRIAWHHGVRVDFVRGIYQGGWRALNALADKRTLPAPVLDQVVPQRFCEERWRGLLRAKGWNQVAVWGIGKDFGALAAAAEKAGVHIACAFPTTGQPYYNGQRSIQGIPVVDVEQLADMNTDGIVIGSLSPGETRNELEYLIQKVDERSVATLIAIDNGKEGAQ